MNQIELLAPAGDEECLRSALDYGCDAVYLAGKSFGMRAGAKNFDMDGLDRAVRFAHERGVKVHLTCNTIPLNSEIEHFPKYIAAAQECGVDAAIACDLGVISMIKEYAPKMELHISTQTGVVNYQTAIELYKMGAKRVVLAREVGLEHSGGHQGDTPQDPGRYGNRDICPRCNVRQLFRKVPDLRVSHRARSKPRRMRAALPLELLSHGRKAPESVLQGI